MSFLSGILSSILGKRKSTKNSRNRINFSTLRKKASKSEKSRIGKGAFGMTFKNPGGVYKFYFKRVAASNQKVPKHDLNANYNRAHTVATITGNKNQQFQIVNGFTKNDFPNNVRNLLLKIGKMPTNNTNLPVIRMPYLGIDLHRATNTDGNKAKIRMIPISILMIQCYELMKQIDKIRKKQMCHGDMKIDNIMIDPKTGKMTIIDFDFFAEFKNLYLEYSNIITRIMRTKGTAIPQYIPPEILYIISIGENIDSYLFYKKYCNGGMMFFLECIGIKGEKDVKDYFDDSFKNNRTYVHPFIFSITDNGGNEVRNMKISNNIMNYFDYFGFGMVMTMFFSRLYPKEPNYKNGEERDAYHKMRKLLMNMCDFSIQKRPLPDNVLQEMQQIMSGISNPLFISINSNNFNENENENENENVNVKKKDLNQNSNSPPTKKRK